MDYSRQASLVPDPKPVVAVVGCGGIGSWTALFLALGGVEHFYLYDGDIIEPSNLARTPYTFGQVGRMKSFALAETILRIRPACDIQSFPHWQVGQDLPLGSEHQASYYLVGAVDGTEVRKDLALAGAVSDIEYIDVGAEAEGWNVSNSPAGWILNDPVPHGYHTPIFIAPVVMAAAAVSWIILTQRPVPQHFRFEGENVFPQKEAK